MLFVRLMLCSTAALVLSACGNIPPRLPSYTVQVDALAGPQAVTQKTYVLVPQDQQIDPSDLQYQEFASYVHRALIARGFVPAQNAKDANVTIGLAYGVSDPINETVNVNIPLRGNTGVLESSETKTSVNKAGDIVTTTTYREATGIIGYRTATEVRTSFQTYAELVGFNAQASSTNTPPSEIWRISMSHIGVRDDIRQMFPLMLAAGAPFIGASTGQRISVSLTESDVNVFMVKGIAIPTEGKPEESKDKPQK